MPYQLRILCFLAVSFSLLSRRIAGRAPADLTQLPRRLLPRTSNNAPSSWHSIVFVGKRAYDTVSILQELFISFKKKKENLK